VPDVVLPVLDEAAAIPSVLASLPPGFHPIVVDNGSRDGSARIADDLGARVVHEPSRGFGAACYAGLLASTADVVCFMDCDGSLSGADLPHVVAPIDDNVADLVLGTRHAAEGAWPMHARLANRALAQLIRRSSGVRVRDLGPMRAGRRVDLIALGIEDRRFGWPLEMVLLAAAQGWRITECPVEYAPRIGRSKVTGTARGTARTIRDMSRVARRIA
jgi:dTDP-L-rhamnose 4-epimerase